MLASFYIQIVTAEALHDGVVVPHVITVTCIFTYAVDQDRLQSSFRSRKPLIFALGRDIAFMNAVMLVQIFTTDIVELFVDENGAGAEHEDHERPVWIGE